jgi:outer membrane protein
VNSKLSLCAALCLAAGAGVQAQNKVAVISVQGAIIATKDGQKAANDLQAKAAPKQKEIETRQSEINSLQDQLTKGQNTLSESAKGDLYKSIETKKKNLQRDVEDASAEMDAEQQKILQTLGQKVLAVIEKYARDQGYTLVVDVSSPQTPVMYASPSIDITKEIVDLYDKSTAAMSAPAPAPKTAPGTAAPPKQPVTPPPTKKP